MFTWVCKWVFKTLRHFCLALVRSSSVVSIPLCSDDLYVVHVFVSIEFHCRVPGTLTSSSSLSSMVFQIDL